ncbi:uncharacterized protein LOC113352327 [Papaver somniferum]|uniref:uncharacterized protein LOC113352327 n=1 Tax=Papaver somniferum TaxID=3469 RepID=UPI000E6FCC1E|nr:uncharacterized protein LOC113352327 [Papaver somniferum]
MLEQLYRSNSIHFWEDVWIGERSLKSVFINLFKISRTKEDLVKDMITADGAWDFHFRRDLNAREILEVANLLQLIGEPPVNVNDDVRSWRYGDTFTIANAYSTLEDGGLLRFPNKQLWNSKVPLKMSFFAWTLCYKREPTLDSLFRAGLVQDENCLMCHQFAETNDHLFFHCKTAHAIWSYFFTSFGVYWVLASDVKMNL